MGHPTLALPTPAHTIENKTNGVPIVTALVGRKQSFRGFSATSLSSLALGRGHSKRNSIGTKKSLNFIMSNFKGADTTSDQSRPPSLITDNSSLTSASSRSPSPEPSSISKLEAAFKTYTISQSTKLLSAVLLPSLYGRSTPDDCSTSPLTNDLEDADIDVLFKWWNHLLLLASPCPATFQSIHAIAAHPALRATMFWNAHYDLTLSTTLSQPADILPTLYFVKLIALGYLHHAPTAQTLKGLFTEPTKTHTTEPWVKRAKNVEVFIELSKRLYHLTPELDDGGVIEARLEEMIYRVIHVHSFPNQRLTNLCRLLSNVQGQLRLKLEDCLVRVTKRIAMFDCTSAFYLLEFLSTFQTTRTDFWLDTLNKIVLTENHVLQIRVFSYLYDNWGIYNRSETALDLLISPSQWFYFFTHWSGIVRDHYMRLLAFKVCTTHPQQVRDLLLRSFETSLLENCQLRDCLPGNPIPNKRFVIRPVNSAKPSSPKSPPFEEAFATSNEDAVDAVLVKKKGGLFRTLWGEDKDECTSKTGSIVPKAEPALQVFKFVPEYIGKQWSLTSDQDAIRFLDSVMDAAREGRLPAFSESVPPPSETSIVPFSINSGRKRLWTRSLSEWSTLIDETDRHWRSCGGRSLSSSGIRLLNSPKLEVEFPRWFVQRSTQVAGDGVEVVASTTMTPPTTRLRFTRV